ncbi:PREDICTED: triacylglycerol lipase [Prunus dulcis]|uniref:PREDICTED: triacylglycerol lipase n=1 Tax=Prunus dulcis TaxID=3755 RepID=A0A5E4EPX6_PRUDU|nr:PREDICTED: triacylglycerol lipase [Prunus dulcis]
MQRLRGAGTVISRSLPVTQLRKKAFRSWAAVQDTYFSTKDIFETHKVVFTVGTSIASVATAWFGYTIRHVHESRVDQRLESIEKAQMKNNHNLEHSEIRNIVNSGSIGIPSCIATAGTTLVVGYALGWRGGRWYANRKFRREQMKLLGQIKPKRWQLLRRSLIRPRTQDNAVKTLAKIKDTHTPPNFGESHQSC